jgi:hypothetical protein
MTPLILSLHACAAILRRATEPPSNSFPQAAHRARLVPPQLGPRTEKRDTFTRLLGLP